MRRRLAANGCAPGRFHSPADKIYESLNVILGASTNTARPPQPLASQPASVWVITLSGTVTLQLRQSKVACIYYTRPALIHNECDMMAAGIPRIPRRWKIARSPRTVTFAATTCAKRRSHRDERFLCPLNSLFRKPATSQLNEKSGSLIMYFRDLLNIF
jgi:hypothetical protein